MSPFRRYQQETRIKHENAHPETDSKQEKKAHFSQTFCLNEMGDR